LQLDGETASDYTGYLCGNQLAGVETVIRLLCTGKKIAA